MYFVLLQNDFSLEIRQMREGERELHIAKTLNRTFSLHVICLGN